MPSRGRYRSLTNSDIAFGVNGAIQASTLPPASWPTLAPLLVRERAPIDVQIGDDQYVAMTRALSGGAGRDALASRRCLVGHDADGDGDRAPLANGTAAISQRAPHAAARHGGRRRARRDAPELCDRADGHEAARGHHRDHARDGGHGRPHPQDPRTPGRTLGRRGCAAAGDDVQHDDRVDRPVPTRGVAARTSLVARTPLDCRRARDSEPADDHQGGVADATDGSRCRQPSSAPR